MTTKKAIEILRKHNEWRRGAEIDQMRPIEIGAAIDLALESMREVEKLPKALDSNMIFFLLSHAKRLDDDHFFSLMDKLDQWKLGRKKDMALSDAYEILKQNVRHESGTGDGFVYLSQIEELLK